jgi:hypothetical protein
MCELSSPRLGASTSERSISDSNGAAIHHSCASATFMAKLMKKDERGAPGGGEGALFNRGSHIHLALRAPSWQA